MPTPDELRQGGPGYDRGSILWLCSKEDGGPDVGIQLGLGDGFALYIGEVSKMRLLEHGIPRVDPAEWWTILYRPHDDVMIGRVHDTEAAREALEHIAGLLSSEPRP